MATCLSDMELASYVDGSASSEQLTAWKSHIDSCDACALKLARRPAQIKGSKKPPPSSTSSSTIAAGTRLGDFEIEKRIGSGGMGIVYQAHQVSLNQRVALKVLPPGLGMTSSAVVRFHREAQAAAKLHHSNIVAVYAVGEQDGTCYYTMELIEGQGLDQIIAEWRQPDTPTVSLSAPTVTIGAAPPPSMSVRASRSSVSSRTDTRSTRGHFDTIAKWVADAADALDYAHKQGVIHCDIKPSNLMLGDEGRVTVMDFGLARMLEEPGMTVSGEFLGTPRYMSPEQIAVGRAKLDHRTDIYSLGATLYELLTLQPPFTGEHRDEIIAAIMANTAALD